MTYDAVLKTENVDWAANLTRGRICAVVLDGHNYQVGQARDFRKSSDGTMLVCTIDADEDRWVRFKEASLEGATLFAGDYPVVGPYVPPMNQEVAYG